MLMSVLLPIMAAIPAAADQAETAPRIIIYPAVPEKLTPPAEPDRASELDLSDLKADRFTYRRNGEIIASDGSVVGNASACLLPVQEKLPQSVAGLRKKDVARILDSHRAKICSTEGFKRGFAKPAKN